MSRAASTTGSRTGTKANRRNWLSRVASILGAALFVWILFGDGGATLLRVATALRYTWPLLLLPFLVNAVLLLLGYRIFLPNRGRDVPWRVLIHVQRSASILNSLLPLGNTGGQIVKVGILQRWYKSEELVAAAAWGVLSLGVCNAIGAVGPLVILATGHEQPWIVAVLALVNLAMAVPAIVILLLVRRGLASRVTRLLGRVRLGLLQRRREKMLAWAERLDLHLASAVGDRKRDFWYGTGLRALAQGVRIFEIWMVVKLIGAPGGWTAVLLYHSINRATTQILSFVPGRLGVLEAIAMTGFSALGYGATTGLELTLALRFRYIVNMLSSALALATLGPTMRRYPAAPTPELAVTSEADAASGPGRS